MRNILAYIPQKDKGLFAQDVKEIWLTSTAEEARLRANHVAEKYARRFPKAITCLENGLEDSLSFYSFPLIDPRKISSANMVERLDREIRRRSKVVGIFPNESSYVRLITTIYSLLAWNFFVFSSLNAIRYVLLCNENHALYSSECLP